MRKRANSRAGILKKRRGFLAALRESGNVVKAAREAGMSKSAAYRLSKHPDYFEAFEAAKVEGEQVEGYRLLEEAGNCGIRPLILNISKLSLYFLTVPTSCP